MIETVFFLLGFLIGTASAAFVLAMTITASRDDMPEKQ